MFTEIDELGIEDIYKLTSKNEPLNLKLSK